MTINDPRDDPRYQVGGDKYKAEFEAASGGIPAKLVQDIHKRSDQDSSQVAQHHTLGTKHDQASPGDHNHDGSNSLKVLAGTTLTGAKTGNPAPALASVIAALVKLGATDATAP